MIKNYTSSVAATRSVSHIEECLARHGAQSVIKQYGEDRRLAAVSFYMGIREKLIPFRLPAKVDQVEKILHSAMKRSPRPGALIKLKEQAERTAWKIISDWVDAQMALIELQQADMAEVFMPYMWNERVGQSFYQIASKKGFNLLEAPK
jgi:hypothetical protein